MKQMTLNCDIEGFGEFDAMLFELEQENDSLEIHICSQGGDIYQSLAYYTRIKNSLLAITTVGYGAVMSAAVLPFIAGKHRILAKECWVMLHETQLMREEGEKDTTTTAAQEIEHIKQTEIQYHQLLAQHTGRKASFWEKKIKGKGDIYLSASEALKLGLCDELI